MSAPKGKSFLIGPIPEGMRKDVKPFAIPENSFENLINANQFRGRIIRRSGYTLLGRLANNTPVMGLRTQQKYVTNEIKFAQQNLIAFDTTDTYIYDNGTQSFINLPSYMPVTWSGTDYEFFYTINYAGAFWATNSKAGLHGQNISNINNANPAVVTTLSNHGFTTGQYVVIINVSGYDPISSSTPSINGQKFLITVITPTTFSLTGLDGSLYGAYSSGGMALNSEVSIPGKDGIRYYGSLNFKGIIGTNDSWANYNPPIDPNNALAGCLLMFSYRGYLVFLNTWEGNEAGISNYGNRARWTQIGTPYYSEPVPTTPNEQGIDVKAARDDLFGRGGANDAPTAEVIVTAGFIRDVLVVVFERSTWRLRFVNNAQNPFVWERVNVELGSDCTFSAIPFDKGLMSIGGRGITISDGNDTSRFDEKIPDDIFTIRQTNNGFDRVYGIRTFRTRLNYWTFPNAENPTGTYPDSVLVFNYETKNWSFFDDCFTCFGYFYFSNPGLTWGDLEELWPSYNTMTAADGITQEGYENVVAGNQQGFVLLLEQTSPQNSASLYINSITISDTTVQPNVTTIINSPNYNLADGSWITLLDITGTTNEDGTSLNFRNYKTVQLVDPITNEPDPDNFGILEFESIDAGSASGSSFSYTTNFIPILEGSVQINVGSIEFKDVEMNGILQGSGSNTGTINYQTGSIVLNFSPPLGAPTEVFIRVVSYSAEQGLDIVKTQGAYTGGGLIAKISNIEILTKIFNFFGIDEGTRLSKIDFYVDRTENGQFTCNIYGDSSSGGMGDSSNIPINTPLGDNPQSNIVLTSVNPYQVSTGADQTIYRLYADCVSQTFQMQLTLSDQQMAVTSINSEDIQLLAMMITATSKGRLV